MTDPLGNPPSIDLGIPSIDAEHRGQLESMRRLRAAIASGLPPDAIADDVHRLVAYLDVHFMSEQIAMRENAYPAYGSHLAEHDDAVAILRGLEMRTRAGDAAALNELLHALEGWLVAHIETSDRSLVEFLVGKGAALP